jgi:hypothetical protein
MLGMIINAAYEGPPYPNTALGACTGCQRGANLSSTSPIAGLSYTTVGIFGLTAIAVVAVGITLWGFNESETMLKGRKPRRR